MSSSTLPRMVGALTYALERGWIAIVSIPEWIGKPEPLAFIERDGRWVLTRARDNKPYWVHPAHLDRDGDRRIEQETWTFLMDHHGIHERDYPLPTQEPREPLE